MNKLRVLIAGATGYIGIQLVKLLLNIKIFLLNICVEIHLLVKIFQIMIAI